GNPPGADDTVGREQGRHVAEGDVCRDEDDAQLVRRQHHRRVYIAGEMGQPFSVARVGASGEMQRALVCRPRDDRVYVAVERQANGPLHCMPSELSRARSAVPLRRRTITGTFTAPGTPGADRKSAGGWNPRYLVLRTEDRDFCRDR